MPQLARQLCARPALLHLRQLARAGERWPRAALHLPRQLRPVLQARPALRQGDRGTSQAFLGLLLLQRATVLAAVLVPASVPAAVAVLAVVAVPVPVLKVPVAAVLVAMAVPPLVPAPAAVPAAVAVTASVVPQHQADSWRRQSRQLRLARALQQAAWPGLQRRLRQHRQQLRHRRRYEQCGRRQYGREEAGRKLRRAQLRQPVLLPRPLPNPRPPPPHPHRQGEPQPQRLAMPWGQQRRR